MTHTVLLVNQGIWLWSQRQKYLITISKQKSSEEHLCQLDANETKPFWDGGNRFNFFHFSSFSLWQNDILFIQSLKQKNDWWSNEGQILFQPLTLFQTALTFFNKMAGPKVDSEDPISYLSRDNLPLLPLSPKYILKENLENKLAIVVFYFFTSLFLRPSLCVQLKHLVTFVLHCWVFLISQHCWTLVLFLINISAPKELVFLFSRINKCSPQMKSGNIWPF